MKIRNVVHTGVRRLIQEDDATGVQPAFAPKLRRIVSFLQDMEREEELRAVPSWRAHRLTGDRKGTWSLSPRIGGSHYGLIAKIWRSSISTMRITTESQI